MAQQSSGGSQATRQQLLVLLLPPAFVLVLLLRHSLRATAPVLHAGSPPRLASAQLRQQTLGSGGGARGGDAAAAGAAAAATTAAPPGLRGYDTPLDSLLAACGEICRIDKAGVPGKFFIFIQKAVDCDALLSNADADAGMLEPAAPDKIPAHLLGAFTYGGRVTLRSYLPDGQLFNQRYLGASAAESEWSEELVEDWKAKCAAGTLEGSYGKDYTNPLRDALVHANVKGSKVLVIGSERPWVEACLLAQGAEAVTTLEYGGIKSRHPQVTTMTPAQARERARELQGAFDAVITFSSIEHSGLGRYGDAMNPWGDRIATARAWCMTRRGGRLLAGVPHEPLAAEGGKVDVLYYNAHRSYGPVQLPHLFANWRQVWRGMGAPLHAMWVVEKP